MKNGTIRKMLAVVGLAAALTGCGEANSTSTPVSEETLQDEPDSATEESKDENSSEDDAEDEKQDDTGETSEPDAGDEEAPKDDAVLEDGEYDTTSLPGVHPNGAFENELTGFKSDDPDADQEDILYKAEISDGVLNITASFVQYSDDYSDVIAYYNFETREIPVSEDLLIELQSGVDADDLSDITEELSIEKFNTFYSDPDDYKGPVAITLKIENGEVTYIHLGS